MISPIQDAVNAAANKLIGTGSAVTVVGAAFEFDFGMWAGITIGVLGLAINLHYKWKADRRAIEANRRAIEAHQYYLNNLCYREVLPRPPAEELEDGTPHNGKPK